MTERDDFRLVGPEGTASLLDRMAARIAAELESFAVVGLLRRGGPLARRLNERLEARLDRSIPVDDLKLKRYSDDLELLHERAELQESTLEIEVEDRTILLVDDVLYSGHTMFRAAAHLSERGAERIRPAVLCSRGPNDVPIHADFVGMQLDVQAHNLIEVHAPPYEDEWAVRLRRRPSSSPG